MMQKNTLLVACLVGFAGMVFSGCAGSESAQVSSASLSAQRADSLHAANERLEARIRLLSDSLQFYDDVQSGQYRREQRALQDRLTRFAYELKLLHEGGRSVATLKTDILFEQGTSQFTPEARAELRAVATQLRTTYRGRAVRVEGHTGRSPRLDSSYVSAWALSAGQAAAVVEALVTLSDRAPSQFQAIACGDAYPVASNETPTGQARNRRIRIAVLPRAVRISPPYETTW